MRKYPTDDCDYKELKDLNAEGWQVEALKMNPDYVWWGNYEDYMMKDNQGWDGRVELKNINELWELDELNELINFYFELFRESKVCKECNESGYNEKTKEISDTYYDFEKTGKKWCYNLTKDEIEVLANYRKLSFKEAKQRSLQVGGCDALDRWLLIETRAKRLGVYGNCEVCNGKGYIYTEPKAKLALQMWFIHPRKGASRGVYLKEIKNNRELNMVIDYLIKARERNYARFSKLTSIGKLL